MQLRSLYLWGVKYLEGFAISGVGRLHGGCKGCGVYVSKITHAVENCRRSGSSIAAGYPCMFRDMGGVGQPLRKCYDPHPGLSSLFVRVIESRMLSNFRPNQDSRAFAAPNERPPGPLAAPGDETDRWCLDSKLLSGLR